MVSSRSIVEGATQPETSAARTAQKILLVMKFKPLSRAPCSGKDHVQKAMPRTPTSKSPEAGAIDLFEVGVAQPPVGFALCLPDRTGIGFHDYL